jgi:hypothetical protein
MYNDIFEKEFFNNISELDKLKELSDLTLRFKDGEIKTTSNILIFRSNFLCSIFRQIKGIISKNNHNDKTIMVNILIETVLNQSEEVSILTKDKYMLLEETKENKNNISVTLSFLKLDEKLDTKYIICFPNIKMAVMNILYVFMTKGDLVFDNNNSKFELLQLSIVFELDLLTKYIELSIVEQLQMNNVVDILKFSYGHNLVNLKRFCLYFIKSNYQMFCETSQMIHLENCPDLLLEIMMISLNL